MTHTRAVLAAATLAVATLASGCSGKPLDATGAAGTGGASGGTSGGAAGTSAAAGRPGTFVRGRDVDILFLIDDSSGTRLAQSNLESNFPSFVSTLEGLPGGLPNLHMAVVSSDMGAGNGSISGCAGQGKGGVFQYTPRGSCTATNLAPGATYISNVAGVANYSGNLADVFTCIADLGNQGCGFEHQLAAVARALGADGRPAPVENQGFLRPDAFLLIVLLTDEDDCSAPQASTLFDTASNLNLASPLGPPSNFRCNEFGHLCNGSKPPRRAPSGNVTDTVLLDNCVPAEASGMLTPVGTFVSQLGALKAVPSDQILVAAITGPAAPYQVHWKNPSTADTGPWPEITHACVGLDTSFADPAVRIGAFVQNFRANGMSFSICDNSFAPALDRIAQRIGEVIAPAP